MDFRIGLQLYEKARSARTTCFCCGAGIGEGLWRVKYAPAHRKKQRDLKWAHCACAPDFPAEHRAVNLARVRRWQEEPGLDAEAYTVLDDLERHFATHGPASSSAGVGA